jgi:hypothetical protein
MAREQRREYPPVPGVHVLKTYLAILAAAMLAGAVPAVANGSQTMKAKVTVTFLGLPVARAELNSTLGDGSFSLQSTFSSAGLARMFDRTTGTAAVSGTLGEPRLKPGQYNLDYRTRKDHSTAMTFARDRVASRQTLPEPPPRNDEWIKLDEADLVGVNDPISGMLIPASGAGDVCNRTVRVFDGEFRVDIGLTPADRKLAGGEVTCRLSFTPRSGYRGTRSAIRFLRDRSRILIAFAPIPGTGVWGPVEASIGTQIGNVHVRATDIRFGR